MDEEDNIDPQHSNILLLVPFVIASTCDGAVVSGLFLLVSLNILFWELSHNLFAFLFLFVCELT